tara:strand:- start:1159 stop:1332 length:174 start_codon:yes stop_codon:yes gene_type:complete
MKIGPLSIVILIISFVIMIVTTLDLIAENPLKNYKLIAGLQFVVIGRFIVQKKRKEN